MKKLTFFATMTIVALVFASCNKNDYSKFVGTWGVEKIEYYNIDYAGNPITSSIETHTYNPQDTDNGIHLVFKADKTGEMRDSAIDTVLTDWNDVTETFDSYIVNPDTVLVYPFTYSYDKFESVLFLTIRYSYPYEYMRTYQMKVSNLTNNTFIYENEYDIHYMERAYLKRINDAPSKSASRQTVKHPHKPGSLLGDR
jgi:hypothetical protein